MRTMFFKRHKMREPQQLQELSSALSHGLEREESLRPEEASLAQELLGSLSQDERASVLHPQQEQALSSSMALAADLSDTAADSLSAETLRQLDEAAAAIFASDEDDGSEHTKDLAPALSDTASGVGADAASSAASSSSSSPVPELSAVVSEQVDSESAPDAALHEEQEPELNAALSAVLEDEDKEQVKGKADTSSDDNGGGGAGGYNLEEIDFSQVQPSAPISFASVLEGDERARYERMEELQAQRASAQRQNFFKLTEESEQYFDALAHRTQLIEMRHPTLLDDEHGEVETEDFVTGNVTILATGTDSAHAISSGAAAGAGAEGESLGKKGELSIEALEYIPGKETFKSTLSLSDSSLRPRDPQLVPMLLRDLLHTWLTYALALCACLLCLAKIYEVQDTRMLTTELNNVTSENVELEKEWLSLVSARQKLSEHAMIRTFAGDQLQMRAPKIESEIVISLTGPKN